MLTEGRNIAVRVNLRDPLFFGFPRFDPDQASDCPALLQPLHNCAQPIGGFRMPGSHIVIEIGWMIDETRPSHSVQKPLFVVCEASLLKVLTIDPPHHWINDPMEQ